MKKALFLAYYYPPYGGGGVQRTTKYVKYLNEHGWEPVVITIQEDKIPLWDESLLKDVPKNLEIHRTDIWGLTFIERLLRLRATKAKKQGLETQETTVPMLPTRSRLTDIGKSALRSFLKNAFLLVYTFMLYPDDKIGWYPFAYRQAKKRMSLDDIDLIYTTSAPFTAHLVGLRLKKHTGKPWVMDLRDPWAGNKYLLFSNLRNPIDRIVEGLCVKKADQIITVSEPIREELLKSYPHEPAEKFIVIPNGYDKEDLVPIEVEPSSKLVFSYTGSFYNEISPRYFLDAMDDLLKKGSLAKEDIRIELAGQFGAESLQLITAFQKAYPEVTSVSGYIPHLESTRRLLSADILLLFLNKGAGRGVLTGKLFEYLGSRKPILAMIPEGLASELINKARAGAVVPPEDGVAIQSAISDFYMKWKAGELRSTTDPEVADQYSRKALAGRLAQVFDKLI